MTAREPTPEQAAAIAAAAPEVLLEAGAGTGKTGVMVARYCRLVCDDGVRPEAVLAFTFTEKAAAELRHRIRAELEARAEAGEERARQLLPGIGAAWVTTIHGFCSRLLAAHPVAAGIDPRFRVLDEAEAGRLAAEAFDEALEQLLATGDPEREGTLAAYGIAALRQMVVDVHAELRSRGAGQPRLPQPPPSDPEAALRHAVAAAAATLEELRPSSPSRALVEAALATLEEDPDPSLERLCALRSDSSAKAMAAYREAIEAAVRAVAERGEGATAYGHVAALLELFSQRFEAAKERRGGLDFDDLQILAARLLERTELGAAYRKRFDHLLVDEFQDTNRAQLRLIEALRGPTAQLAAVGDELQSIYGFRHADLEVFRERRAAVRERPDAQALALSGNFRSRPELLGAVDALGAQLLGESFRPLRVGAPPRHAIAPGGGTAVELLLTGRDGWDGEGIELEPATDATTPANLLAEARFLAARLAELAEAGVDRTAMVVLLRAFTHLDAYEDSLERAGLRPYVVGGRGFWSGQQVGDVRALLAVLANPLDDEALFGALASPACGAAPDTLWLLRAAAGRGRHVWPALERLAGLGEAEPAEPERLRQIPAAERELVSETARRLGALRERSARLPLAELIDAVVSETGYDLAVLARPSGEARFANVRKLMRLAAEFEAGEGRDLRGLLDFLATRAEADADAAAATAAEGHDGVRIMTVHSAKGLEFDVVAVPGLSRRLLAGSRAPLLTIGREDGEPRVGMQLRRLGAGSLNLFAHDELREEQQRRDAEEELRLFHVAATRARERLLLSGTIAPEPVADGPGKPVVERIADAFGVDREADSAIAVPPPQPRQGFEARFEPSEIAVRLNLASPQRAAELRARRSSGPTAPEPAPGEAPLRRPATRAASPRSLSYTALAAYRRCPYRFRMEHELGLAPPRRTGGDGAAARGAATHALLEWSARNGWAEPPPQLARRHAAAEGLDPDAQTVERLLGPLRAWLGSALFAERVAAAGAIAAELPLLLEVEAGAGRSVVRGSIDLLAEADGAAPLVVDYKTDRLEGAEPAERAGRYELQRDIYALAVAAARGAPQVEVAYVFLERPERPALATLGPEQLGRGRERLAEAVAEIAAGRFPAAPSSARDWDLCRGCPALGTACPGPADADTP